MKANKLCALRFNEKKMTGHLVKSAFLIGLTIPSKCDSRKRFTCYLFLKGILSLNQKDAFHVWREGECFDLSSDNEQSDLDNKFVPTCPVEYVSVYF